MKEAEIFPGDTETAALMRATDWGETALGAPHSWPASLKAHARALVRTRQPMCIFWGPDLINVYNDGFLPILGEKHPAAMGQRAEDCWREAWPIVGPQLTRVMAGESILHEEVVVPIARGGRLDDAWWNYSYSPLFDDDGSVGGVLVICTEVTREIHARKELEEAAARHALARKQADAANRAKDEFLATVSHELRTPLTAILGWARMLEGTTDRDRLDKGLAVIERNALAQAKLIDDILDVSRIVSGKLRLVLGPVDVTKVIESAVESVRPAAAAKAIGVHVDITAGAEIVADEDRVQQIVWNLLSNAVKFTPRGGDVAVRAREDGDGLRIVVSDTGRGITPAFLPHVFDRFRQADATTTKQHGGLGLGLAIVRHLVELHGGSIAAKSDGEGRGATFEIILPLRASEACAESDAVSSAPSTPRLVTALEGVRILVVDDEPDVRELVAAVLEDAGGVVLCAASASDALEVLARGPVAVIISDIAMPLEDGYSLLARLRAAEKTRAIPAVAFTAFARAEDRARALAAGFQAHIAKPLDPSKLVATVAAVLAD